jgi:hypothetical protein
MSTSGECEPAPSQLPRSVGSADDFVRRAGAIELMVIGQRLNEVTDLFPLLLLRFARFGYLDFNFLRMTTVHVGDQQSLRPGSLSIARATGHVLTSCPPCTS